MCYYPHQSRDSVSQSNCLNFSTVVTVNQKLAGLNNIRCKIRSKVKFKQIMLSQNFQRQTTFTIKII